MTSTHRHLFACLLLGCTGQPSESTSTTEARTSDSSSPGPDGETDEAATATPAIALTRGVGHDRAVTEVWLDAAASSALTLDAGGNVRLWPSLPPSQTDPAALAPIRVPVREPLWLSHARAGERRFVVAAIDTAQAARVFEVEIDDEGAARLRTRVATPPTDPLLEIHVLDGGERLLALGVDHRIRLYDGRGQLLSELTEYGLAPWQLRVAGPPDALQLAMVLAGPTRLQRFTIAGDKLTKRGDARAFTLDRGPNHNDLALLPSGRVAAVLRRPLAKGLQWSIELHDLDSGEVRVLWGEIESKWRPRMHVVDEQRVLLEDGIAGYWVDLRQAVVMPQPFELPEKLEELPPETHVSVTKVPLPGTEQRLRKHTSVVAGVRVVPSEFGLLLDPVEGERHQKLGHRNLASVRSLDFDSSGELLAIAYTDKVRVLSLTTGAEQPSCEGSSVRAAFIDADHLVLFDGRQARICEWRTGEILATVELLPEDQSFETTAVHGAKPGAGEIGAAWRRWQQYDDGSAEFVLELVHASYANNQFGAVEPLSKSDAANWTDLRPEGPARDAAGNRYKLGKGTRKLQITLASGEKREIAIVDPGDDKIDIRRIEPSPDGRFVAIVTAPEPGYGYGHGYGYFYGYEPDPETLGVWAIASDPPELRFDTVVDNGSLELAWTDDGSRLAMHEMRLRVLTNTGDVVLDHASRDLQVEELPDAPSPTSTP